MLDCKTVANEKHLKEGVSREKSYYIDAEHPNTSDILRSLDWLRKNSKQKGFLAVQDRHQTVGDIGDVLGQRDARTLRARGNVRKWDIEIVLITPTKVVYDGDNSPLLVFYANADFLDKLDSIPNISAMLVVGSFKKDIKPWITAWNATELGTRERPRQTPLLRSRVVEESLKSLTLGYNSMSGLVHQSDKETVIQYLKILRDEGEPYAPEEIKAWLIAEGHWKATHAQEVAEIAERVLDAGYRDVKLHPGAKRLVDSWKKKGG